jgi:hypothetical protein
MMWFSVVLLFERLHAPKAAPHGPLWEEAIFLVRANGEQEARAKATSIGEAKQLNFHSLSGEMIEWRFAGIQEVYEILDEVPSDCSEVFSKFLTSPPSVRLQD